MSTIKSMKPERACEYLHEHIDAVLLDVRSTVEYTHVGHPIGSLNIPWKNAPDWSLNPDFIDRVRSHVPDLSTPVLLLCRSGQRSMEAARALAEAGYTDLTNIEEGFEGPLDTAKHRGYRGGWRFHGLPWEQT